MRDILEALWILLTWHCEISIPDERSDWPTLVIYELIDSSELGTDTNHLTKLTSNNENGLVTIALRNIRLIGQR